MKLTNSIATTALIVFISGGFMAGQALADLPAKPGNISVMDTNKNGKIEKDEYLAYMAKGFDESAGSKGYCTFAEVEAGFKKMAETFNIFGLKSD